MAAAFHQSVLRATAGLLFLLIISCNQSRTDLPPLPGLPLSTYSESLQEKLKPAYDRARSNPDDAEAVGQLGLLLQAHSLFDSAETIFRRARGLAPESFRWIYHLALTQAAAGKNTEAIESFRQSLKQNPGYTAATIQLADALLATGQSEEAAKLYYQVVEKDPGYAQAHYGLGRIAAANKQHDQAIEHLQKALALYPGYGAARYALALSQRQTGKEDEAKQNLEFYEKNRTGRPPADDELLDSMQRLHEGPMELVRRAQMFEKQGQLEEAVATQLEALRLDPKFEQAHVNLISLYGRLGQADKAGHHYQEAVRLNPNLAESHYNYGVLMVNQKRPDAAREAFKKALQSNPNYAEAHNNLGYLLMESGNLELAAKHFQQALDNKPGHKLAHYHLARILLHKGRRPDAIAHLEQAASGDVTVETPMLTFALAAAYAQSPAHRRQAHAKAQEAYDLAMKLDQRDLAARISQDLPRLFKLSRIN